MVKDVIEKTVIKENAKSFSEKVEDMVWMKDIPYLEAIKRISEELGFEPQQVPKLLTQDLFLKLSIEAEELLLIKKTKRLQV